jgi:hypothetical protein
VHPFDLVSRAEEPFGIYHINDNQDWEVEKFFCQVNGPREGGRYNLSVALLGKP